MNFLTALILRYYENLIFILFLVVSSRTSDLACSINSFSCVCVVFFLVIATFVTRLLGADSNTPCPPKTLYCIIYMFVYMVCRSQYMVWYVIYTFCFVIWLNAILKRTHLTYLILLLLFKVDKTRFNFGGVKRRRKITLV